MKNDRRKSTMVTSIVGIVTAAVISTVIALSIATAAMDTHMDDAKIHRDYEALAKDFMPREALELNMASLSESIRRIEIKLGTVKP